MRLCNVHPRYTGKRPPRSVAPKCTCAMVYAAVNKDFRAGLRYALRIAQMYHGGDDYTVADKIADEIEKQI